jgi:beta-fructofuranosidase
MQAVRAAVPLAAADPERPVYHFHPPANWNNDPNGTIFHNGWHHLFYQHNPFEAKWGHMHWGHARSRDLVNWEHLPIALWPSIEKGEDHVFSGGAIQGGDGRVRLVYTSIGKRDPEQWLAAASDDELIGWEKHPRNPIATLKLHGSKQVFEWRDPFLFRERGQVYMVCGGNGNGMRRGGAGEVQLYRAARADLSEWKHLGAVFQYRDRQVSNIECPNLFRVGSKWVLIISPHKSCEYFVGDLDLNRVRFVPQTHGVLDPGTAYASNISIDDKGRVILWLWGRTETKPEKGWNSVMTMPRILSIDSDGFLRQTPPAEFASLRGEPVRIPATALDAKPRALGEKLALDTLEIEADFEVESADAVGLRLRCSSDGKAGAVVKYNARSGAFSIGSASTLFGREKNVRLRVFLDKRVVEAYINDGAAAIFTTVNAAPKDLGIEAFAAGGTARLRSLTAWPLRPAGFDLARFK